MLSFVNFAAQLHNERRDIPMLHDLQHQFAYNPWTRIGLKSPICA